LDPAANTVGFAWILSARLFVPNAAVPPFDIIEDFCRRFNPEHARLAPERITMIGRGIKHIAEQSNTAAAAIPLLQHLLSRYPPSPTFLTTLHPLFLSLCVSTRHFATALPFIYDETAKQPIVCEISTALSDLHYNDNLIYHYACGFVMTAMKRWKEAEDFFEAVVSAPAQAPAALQLEAYKKLGMVQLILYGKIQDVPKYANSSLVRAFKATAYAYLGRLYPSRIREIQEMLQKHEQIFVEDQNVGLVKQVIEYAPRWNIKKLTDTYLTLSVKEIGREIGIEDEGVVRGLVVQMIADDQIAATIAADGTVTFRDATNVASKDDIDKALRAAQQQATLLSEMNRQWTRSKDYLMKAMKGKDEPAWGAGGDEDILMRTDSNWAEEM